MFFQLAWRNLWRNPKRTLVLVTAVIVGVWSMIVLGALMRGVSAQMVRNSIADLTGHIQIHETGYRSDPVVENSIPDPRDVIRILQEDLPAGALWAPRIRVGAVVSNARHSAGVTLAGIDPPRERTISFIGRAVTRGRYLQPGDDNGILIGRALADKFEAGVGKKLVLMSQDRNGDTASRAFRINGIFQAELKATEKQYVFVNLRAAADMLHLGNGISGVTILLAHRDQVPGATALLRKKLAGRGLRVSSWQEILPFLVAVLRLYDGFIFIWFLVIFIAMGFGIVNTTLMAVFERTREFGLLKALGMKPAWIFRLVLTESSLLLLLSQFIGNGLGALSLTALEHRGIDLSALAQGIAYVGLPRIIYPVILARDILTANLVVFGLGLLVSFYPAIKAGRLIPVKALTLT
jgi:putative ABC transport system permease protein